MNPNTFPFGSDLEILPLSILLFLAVDMQGRKCSRSGSGRLHCLEERVPQDKPAWLDLQGPRLGSHETMRPSWPTSGAEFLASAAPPPPRRRPWRARSTCAARSCAARGLATSS